MKTKTKQKATKHKHKTRQETKRKLDEAKPKTLSDATTVTTLFAS